jgi:hypothetical protein
MGKDMRAKLAFTVMVFLLVLLANAQTEASPNCTLPYNLANGQTADASQVMANYNAIIGSGCVGSAASAGANSDITSLSGLTSPLPTPGGFLNKFRNGTMDIWQRGSSAITVSTSGAYTADGWIVSPGGASVTVQQAAGRQLTAYSLQVTGASGATDVIVKQRIESVIASPLSGQTVTVQARIYNSTGGSITPNLTVKHAASADSWSSPVTDVNAASLQSAANGQWTQIAYTFAASTSSGNGLEISFDFGNNFSSSSKTVRVTELDIRATSGLTIGINNNPSPPELRPVASELPFCQRYYATSYDAGTAPGSATHSGMVGPATFINGMLGGYYTVIFPVPMRTAVSSSALALYDGAGNLAKTSYLPVGGGTSSFTDNANGTLIPPFNFSTRGFTFEGGPGNVNGQYYIHYTVSVEL